MDPAAKKKALRMIGYGLYVATAQDSEGPAAGTINWLSQSSFVPPLVMVAMKADSRLYRAAAASGAFVIHVVGKSQKDLAVAFFKGAEPSEGKLNGYRVETGKNGALLLTDPPAWFECRVVNEVTGGDHIILVGEVVDAGIRSEEEPLTLRETGFAYGG